MASGAENNNNVPIIISTPAKHSPGVSSHETTSCASCDLDNVDAFQRRNLEQSVRELEARIIHVDEVLGYRKQTGGGSS